MMSNSIEQLFTEDTWLLLDHIGILLGNILMLGSIIGGTIGIIKRNDLRLWLSRNQFPSIGGDLNHTRWQGLVFTVSRDDVPQWVIQQVRPRAIGLLTTTTSQDKGTQIQQTAEAQGIIVLKENLNNPDDPAECKRKTAQLIQDLHERQYATVAVDITGGKLPMSLGAFMAAEENGCATLYVSCAYPQGKLDQHSARLIAISGANA